MNDTPERWKRIEELYNAALKVPLKERDDYLADVCAGQDELQSEVQSLLAQEARTEHFLEKPAIEIVARFAALAAKHQHMRAGDSVAKYRIVDRIGDGGMGIVYKAEDPQLRRFVALKFLPEHVVADALALLRFEHEAQAASALDHPNICTVYEIGEHCGTPFIAMQYLDGSTLKDLIAAKLLSLESILDLATQITHGLEAAHAQHIIHRDIKPRTFLSRSGASRRFWILASPKSFTFQSSLGRLAVGLLLIMRPPRAGRDSWDCRLHVPRTGAGRSA